MALLEGQDENHDRVVFDITEGPQVRVGKIAFAGFSQWTAAAKLASETRTQTVNIGLRLSLRAKKSLRSGFVVSLEERNFDPHRWPKSWAELYDGRAFRGGGEKVRIELTVTPFFSYWQFERSLIDVPKK